MVSIWANTYSSKVASSSKVLKVLHDKLFSKIQPHKIPRSLETIM